MERVRLLRTAGLTAARALEGRFWRAVTSSHPLDTGGTQASGGRFNPRWEFGVLYCSDSPQLALAEESAQGDAHDVQVIPVDVALARVLDLTDPLIRSGFLLRREDLTGDDRELTQRVGRAARAAGLEALLVPSVHGGTNLVVFLDRLDLGAQVRLVEGEQAERYALAHAAAAP